MKYRSNAQTAENSFVIGFETQSTLDSENRGPKQKSTNNSLFAAHDVITANSLVVSSSNRLTTDDPTMSRL